MTEKVSTMEVRQRIGDLLNRVALRHDEFIIERKGKALAALVPVARLEQMQRAARGALGDLLARRKAAPEKMPAASAMELALAAQRAARAKPRRRTVRTKPARK